ncbi:hypothetical protein M1N19_02220, partial [Dehalococcoidia bacterium]|nr:hypothetical protein [Dehalococcoidia bacterium]
FPVPPSLAFPGRQGCEIAPPPDKGSPPYPESPQVAIPPLKTPYHNGREPVALRASNWDLGEKVRKYCRATLALWLPAFLSPLSLRVSIPPLRWRTS